MTEILISLREAIDAIESVPEGNWKASRYTKELEKLDPVQPEIIRCRDCAWGMTGNFSKKFFCSLTGALVWVEPTSFCSYAERKTDESD